MKKIATVLIAIFLLVIILYGIHYIYNQQQVIKQQGAEIEAEKERQRILNEDKDGDGLTYGEEQQLGTSDNNPDTDGDAVPDKYDTNPVGGGRYINKLYEYDYGGYKWTMTLGIHTDWYDYYKNKDRVISKIEYVTSNDKTIQSIARLLEEDMKEEGWSCKSCFAIAYVQSLHYVKDASTGFDEYPKYPVETLIDETGDCEDTAYLAASIIRAMGVDVILINLPGHMAVGVWCEECIGSYYEWEGKKYFYLETTGEGWELGEIPEQYKGQSATLIEIP